jgi:acetyl-CoA carboxylase alpha subunit
MAFYLEFEKKIEEIGKDLEVAQLKNVESAVSLYEKELKEEINKTYKNLTPYQKLQLARHIISETQYNNLKKYYPADSNIKIYNKLKELYGI